ncbi:hypothetical protein JCM10207_003911 [Rhodosporidiobolus poonsookiae]
MTDVYITPSVLSRPATPSRSSSNGSNTGPVPSSSFDPSSYLVTADYPPVPPLPTGYDALSVGAPGGVPDPNAGAPAPFAGAEALPLPPSGHMTRAASQGSSGASRSNSGRSTGAATRAGSGAGGGAGGGFVSFDPNDDGDDLGLDDDDDEDERAVEGRPRKRKSTRDLRGAAQAQASGAVKGEEEEKDDKARRKIQIEYIEEKSKRHITFSKRKAGIMKKAYELSTLTGTQVLLLVVSESGWVYTFTTDKFKPLVKEDENGQLSQGQKLIAACLEAKDGNSPNLAAAAYQPTNASSTGNFEANSAIHGGQISLKTGRRAERPVNSNRRVSSRGRAHIPAAINVGAGPMDNGLPCPPGSGGVPPVPQLPTPLTGNYLDPGVSPISPHHPSGAGPRSLSHPPISPARPGYSMQQQQQQQHHPGHQQEYMEMTQRTDMLHLQAYDPLYDPYSTVPPTSSMYQQDHLPHPPQHASHHHSSGHPGSAPHTPHRTLRHQPSHGHLSHGPPPPQSQAEYDPYALPVPPQSNYTHVREHSLSSLGGGGGMQDPRQTGGGWQTPQHQMGSAGGSLQGTPAGGMYAQVVGGDDGYGR